MLLEEAKESITIPEVYNQIGYAYMKVKDLKSAESNLKMSINMVPNRFIPRDLLLEVYLNNKDTLRAKEVASQIENMPVKVHSSHISLIKQKAYDLLNKNH